MLKTILIVGGIITVLLVLYGWWALATLKVLDKWIDECNDDEQ